MRSSSRLQQSGAGEPRPRGCLRQSATASSFWTLRQNLSKAFRQRISGALSGGSTISAPLYTRCTNRWRCATFPAMHRRTRDEQVMTDSWLLRAPVHSQAPGGGQQPPPAWLQPEVQVLWSGIPRRSARASPLHSASRYWRHPLTGYRRFSTTRNPFWLKAI